MRRTISFLPFIALVVLSTLSCDNKNVIEKEDGTKDTEQVEGPQVITYDAEKGSLLVVTFSGGISGLEDMGYNFEFGIEYSTEELFNDNNATRIKANKNYWEDSFSVDVSGICSGATYYYRAYYIIKQQVYFGEIKSFTFEWTSPEVSTLGVILQDHSNILMQGLVKDKGAVVRSLSHYYPYGFYGIQYSTTDSFDESSTTYLCPNLDTDYMESDSIICTMTHFSYDTTYYYCTFFRLGNIVLLGEIKSFKFEMPVAEAIDLGLKVKWASFNVGATKPEDSGYYYAWGETEPKSYYDWETYKYCNGSLSTLTKYNTNSDYGVIVDDKFILDLEDDVAHVKWGGNWRMPTYDEYYELYKNCTFTDTIMNGVRGDIITSKIPGFEGSSIFLPFSTFFSGDQTTNPAGMQLYGWASSLSYSHPFFAQVGGAAECDRSCGLPVRPVCP